MITPEQCRAARGFANWSQEKLAEEAKVSRSTIRDFEKGSRIPLHNNLAAIQSALEAEGVIFIDDGAMAEGGPGVRLKAREIISDGEAPAASG